MASTPEMLRLIRHAADLLDEQKPEINGRLAAETRYSAPAADAKVRAWTRATAEQVAISYASAILRMVAACMDDEPAPQPAAIERGPDGKFRRVEQAVT